MASPLPSGTKTDILIIGGGLAGLALADHLNRSGRDYLLIEARDRLGGRIRTKTIDGAGFDLGPAWFWPGQPRMEVLAQRFNLEIFEQYSLGDMIAEDGQGNVQRGVGWASMEGAFRIQGGISRIVDELVAQLPAKRLHAGHRAIQIEKEPNYLRVRTERDSRPHTIDANKVVLALPPRLAESAIAFLPDLAEPTRETMRRTPTWMAGQAKIVAVYDHPYWREAGLSGDAVSQRGPMVEIHDASPASGGPYGLFGFMGIAAATRREHEAEIRQLAGDQLVRLFGAEMAHPKELILKDWAHSRFTATPLDHESPRVHPAYGRPQTLSNIWQGTLLFGSTELGMEFGGYLEGALEVSEHIAAQLA